MSAQDGPVRVLVVDDEPMLRKLLTLLLDRSGRYAVIGTAGDGLEAIDLARTLQPDVVLLDLSMPRMDGLEALPHLRQALPAARVIVLSGFTARGASHAASKAGAHAYLEKGLSPTALIAALDDAVGPPSGEGPGGQSPRTPLGPDAPGGAQPADDGPAHQRRAERRPRTVGHSPISPRPRDDRRRQQGRAGLPARRLSGPFEPTGGPTLLATF